MDQFLWVVVPYLCLATFVVGHFGGTGTTSSAGPRGPPSSTRTGCSRLGSPLFHFGMLGVAGGHIIGLLVPRSWTEAVGIGDHAYHYDRGGSAACWPASRPSWGWSS